MQRGFTLVELMVVAGIMAFLGAAATGGYSAFQRGMAERGATGAASSLLKAARERAEIDRSPVMVFCYNRLIREATADDNAIVVGEAVAIRRAGRITYASGQVLVDEFADFVGSYDLIDKGDADERGGIRLWKFDDRSMTRAEYSVIADAVFPLADDVKLHTYEGWAFGEDANPDAEDASVDFSTVNPKSGARSVVTRSGDMKSMVYAFKILDAGTATWRVGTAYGFEFARIQLPHNFTFGKSIPSTVDSIQDAGFFYFEPDSDHDESKSVEVYFCPPDASGKPKASSSPAGTASSRGDVKI